MKNIFGAVILLGVFLSCSLTIKDEKDAGATITTNKTASIEGYVELVEGSSLSKRLNASNSIALVTVYAYFGDSAYGSDQTNDEGYFKIDKLPLLEYRIVAIHPNSAIIEVGYVELKEDIVLPEPVQFTTQASKVDCDKLSQSGNSLTVYPDSGGQDMLGNYDSLILVNTNNELTSSLYSRGSLQPDISDPIIIENGVLYGRVSNADYDLRLGVDSDCAVRMDYRNDAEGVWEGSYRFTERCELFDEIELSASFAVDSGIAKFDIYDSLRIERLDLDYSSKIWMRSVDEPEISLYTKINSDSLFGRNASLKYDMGLKLDKTCHVRMNYRYDSKGYWEETSRWKMIRR